MISHNITIFSWLSYFNLIGVYSRLKHVYSVISGIIYVLPANTKMWGNRHVRGHQSAISPLLGGTCTESRDTLKNVRVRLWNIFNYLWIRHFYHDVAGLKSPKRAGRNLGVWIWIFCEAIFFLGLFAGHFAELSRACFISASSPAKGTELVYVFEISRKNRERLWDRERLWNTCERDSDISRETLKYVCITGLFILESRAIFALSSQYIPMC